jgi:hypothetical protein
LKFKAQTPKFLLLLGLTALTACGRGEPASGPSWTLHTSRLEALSIIPSFPSLPLRWPQFLLAEGADHFLWGEKGIFRLASSPHGPLLEQPRGVDLTRGMDRLIAAAQAPDGKLAVLDMSGRVAVQDPRSGRTWDIEAQLSNQPAGLALTQSRAYVLLQGEPLDGDAVVAYGFDGAEAGRWGKIPADGILQASLRGGGIAACPDGSVFYSYINSPRILRLEDGADESVQAIGEPRSTFVAVPARKVRQAYGEVKRSSSVAPLIKLGLGASRVMSLLCSQEGLLLRQVAQPARGGVLIEVWDPRSEELVGTIPVGGDEVLLDVRDQILYLGARAGDKDFTLVRVRYDVERSRPSEVASR